jgi:N6-adenosine-specific RNA methylase IME4
MNVQLELGGRRTQRWGGPYEIIYIDFPWPRTPSGTAKTPYKTMTWEEIQDFDLGQFLAPDAVVFAWTTGPTHLKECAALSYLCDKFKLYEAGIAYKWIKTTKAGKPIGASGPRPKLVKQLFSRCWREGWDGHGDEYPGSPSSPEVETEPRRCSSLSSSERSGSVAG